LITNCRCGEELSPQINKADEHRLRMRFCSGFQATAVPASFSIAFHLRSSSPSVAIRLCILSCCSNREFATRSPCKAGRKAHGAAPRTEFCGHIARSIMWMIFPSYHNIILPMQHEQRRHPRDFKVGPLQEAWEADRERVRPYLLRQIEAAFDGVELGGGVSLHQARAIDDCASDVEIRAARALDTERRWQDVSDKKLEHLSDTLSMMDAEGFRFYIPRFMTFALRNEGSHSSAGDHAIYWTKAAERNENRFGLLSEEQRAAIEDFADFFSEER